MLKASGSYRLMHFEGHERTFWATAHCWQKVTFIASRNERHVSVLAASAFFIGKPHNV